MARVYLEGNIAKFGSSFPVKEGLSVANIFKLISAQVEGFRNYIIECADKDIGFTIQHGSDFLEEEDLLLNLTKEDIIISEVPAGSKGGGGKILAAIAIAALLIINPAGIFSATTLLPGSAIGQTGTVAVTTGLNAAGLALAGVAANLAIAGLSEILAPGPEVDSAESNQASLFNGPINTIQQGQAVPIAYGELIVGGSPISISFSSAPISPSFATYSPTASPVANPVTTPASTTVFNGNTIPTQWSAYFGSWDEISFNIEENFRG